MLKILHITTPKLLKTVNEIRFNLPKHILLKTTQKNFRKKLIKYRTIVGTSRTNRNKCTSFLRSQFFSCRKYYYPLTLLRRLFVQDVSPFNETSHRNSRINTTHLSAHQNICYYPYQNEPSFSTPKLPLLPVSK